MPQRKKAGCTGYANVTDDYMLYNAATATPSKATGGVRRRRGGDNTQVPDFIGKASDMLNSLIPQAAQLPQVPQVPQVPQAVTQTGGSRRRGGCTSSCSASRKGGAIELAPFAASLAFLAARMSIDDKINFTKLLRLKSSKSSDKPVSRTSRTSRTSRKTA